MEKLAGGGGGGGLEKVHQSRTYFFVSRAEALLQVVALRGSAVSDVHDSVRFALTVRSSALAQYRWLTKIRVRGCVRLRRQTEMAKAKKSMVVRLVSQAGTGFFYTVRKAVRANAEKCVRPVNACPLAKRSVLQTPPSASLPPS